MPDPAVADRQELLTMLGRHWNPPAATMLAATNRQVELRSEGAEVVAEDGSRALDFAGSYGVFLVGHGNPAVRAAVTHALENNPTHVPGTRHPAVERMIGKLGEILAEPLVVCGFGSSGAHVAELALRIALLARTGRTKIAVISGGYHGKTLGALTTLGSDGHRDPFAVRTPQLVRIPAGDVDAAEAAVRDGSVAALLAEPVLGGGHLRVPPRGWFGALARSCRDSGTLFVADEIQTGLGRTGRMWAADHDGVIPDISLISKSLTGGVIPVGAIAARPEVLDAARAHPHAAAHVPELLDEIGIGGGIGSALAAAAAAAAIDEVRDRDLPARAASLGPELTRGLQDAVRRHPRHLLDAPGLGLMAGLRTRNPAVETLIAMQMTHRGVHLGHSLNEDLEHPVLRFYPPLTVESDQIQRCLAALEESLLWLDRRPRVLTRGITGLLRRQRRLPPALVMRLNHSPLSVNW